jgi:hypothetical protein
MNNLVAGNELYVNNKWFFDVISITEASLEVRIKYKEAQNRQYELYKIVKLPIDLVTIEETKNNLIYCTIDNTKLKTLWGSLVDRIVKESNPYNIKINEDASSDGGNTVGMGDVSNATLSGTPGVPGGAGSGDIYNTVISSSTLYRGAKSNKPNKENLKKALLNILGMKEDLQYGDNTDNDYKVLVYQFLEYPWTKDIEIDLINEILEWKAEFLDASPVRIKLYFKELFDLNSSLINSKCSDTFINQISQLF